MSAVKVQVCSQSRKWGVSVQFHDINMWLPLYFAVSIVQAASIPVWSKKNQQTITTKFSKSEFVYLHMYKSIKSNCVSLHEISAN